MQRRDFLKATAAGGTVLWIGCQLETDELATSTAESEGTVTLYDSYAQALYYDGTEGPKTGTITVELILAGVATSFDFWHGHGGKKHRFEITVEQWAELKTGARVYIQTTEVDGHSHKLFVDPVDPKYRVPGAMPVVIPVS